VNFLLSIKKRFLSYQDWIIRWRCMPIPTWINAAELYGKGDFASAIPLYQKGLQSHPHSRARINALLDVAHCLFRLSRFEEAETYLRQATATAPRVRESYVRLARLQLWLGYATEALWTMRVCVQKIPIDPELAALFVTAVVESGANPKAVAEADELLRQIHYDAGGFPRLEVARVRLAYVSKQCEEARDDLSKMAALDRGPFDAVVSFAEVLLGEGKVAYARHHLHRALAVAPEHPKVLRLLARSYLYEGVYFEPDFAVQLALKASQLTNWRGIHELYILAQAYVASGDKASGLLAATKAKQVAVRLLGGYPEVERLEKMLQGTAVESQA
jgi:tetratricopeptide (TPR) repeat protein